MRYCQNCKKDMGLYTTKRKKFCSTNCRVQYHRKAKPHELYSEAVTIISKYQDVQKADVIAAIDSLYALKVMIDSALLHLGDKNQLAKNEMLSDLSRRKSVQS